MIGRVGLTGNTTGPHLHLEIWSAGRAGRPAPRPAGAPVILDLGPIVRGLVPFAPVVAAAFGLLLAAALVARLVPVARQRAYDRASATETVRLVIALPARVDADPSLAVECIRAIHPRAAARLRRLARRLAPRSSSGSSARGGALAWEIETNRQTAALVETSLRTLYPGVAIETTDAPDRPPAAVAIGRLTGSAGWPLREVAAPEARVLRALAAALEHAPADAEVRLRLIARPVPPDVWRRAVTPPEEAGSTSGSSLIGRAVIDAILLRPTAATGPAGAGSALARRARGGEPQAPRRRRVRCRPPPRGRRRHRRRRRGAPVAPRRTSPPSSTTAGRRSAGRSGVAPAGQRRPPGSRTGSSRSCGTCPTDRSTAPALPAPVRSVPRHRASTGASGSCSGESRGRPFALPADALARHLAVFGSTGSGKSTLLLNLVLALAESPIGATVIDPHGDLTTDILERLPASAATRVHVLRLADRDHPRGFNFLERTSPDEAQLVTSEFVELFEDLWPRFCGPKMQHYLRHALLTLLATPEPGTIIELTRILTDDAFREPLVDDVTDPLVAAFWRTEWPGPKERERDSSIKAVLNKLGAFVTYASIRNVVGQGVSTIRPRALMDRGDILLVDLSGVGGDNANLFGAMLISRCLIDATGRQGTPRESRRQHVLVVDEAQRFDTRALGKIAVEGRKFGLALALASQSLGGLGERLRNTVLTNAACLALLVAGRRRPARARAPGGSGARSTSSQRCAGSRCCSGCRGPTAARASTAGRSARPGRPTRPPGRRSWPGATRAMPGRSTTSRPRSPGGRARSPSPRRRPRARPRGRPREPRRDP